MAKQSRSKAKSNPPPAFRGFLNIVLVDAERSHIKSLEFPDDMFIHRLEKLISNGYKVAFQDDDYNHSTMVICSHSDKEHEDYGILLSARGSTAVKALKQLIYMLEVRIADSSWTSMLDSSTVAEIDD